MSNLIQAKITEARLLLEQASQEETEGATLAQQIQELTLRSTALTTSAHEKRVIATSQLKAAESLNGGSTEIVVAAPAASPKATKKTGKKAAGKKAAKAKAAAAAAAPVAAAPAAAAPVTAKKAAKAPKAPKAAKAKGAEKRVASGQMPPLHERLRIVIAADSVTIPQAIERLRAHDKSWVPKSDDLNAYISLVLSTHTKDLFDRVSRGVYKVKKGAATAASATPSQPPAATAPKAGKKQVTASKTNGAQNPSNGSIDDLGSNVLSNPFADTAAA